MREEYDGQINVTGIEGPTDKENEILASIDETDVLKESVLSGLEVDIVHRIKSILNKNFEKMPMLLQFKEAFTMVNPHILMKIKPMQMALLRLIILLKQFLHLTSHLNYPRMMTSLILVMTIVRDNTMRINGTMMRNIKMRNIKARNTKTYMSHNLMMMELNRVMQKRMVC
jgi:hypothetical protein